MSHDRRLRNVWNLPLGMRQGPVTLLPTSAGSAVAMVRASQSIGNDLLIKTSTAMGTARQAMRIAPQVPAFGIDSGSGPTRPSIDAPRLLRQRLLDSARDHVSRADEVLARLVAHRNQAFGRFTRSR